MRGPAFGSSCAIQCEKPAWIRALSSLLRANLVNFGAASPVPNLRGSLFPGGVAGLPRRRFWVQDVAAERIELALKGGTPDTQPPRDLGHAAAIMRGGESDGFDLLKHAEIAFPSRSASAAGGLHNRGRN